MAHACAPMLLPNGIIGKFFVAHVFTARCGAGYALECESLRAGKGAMTGRGKFSVRPARKWIAAILLVSFALRAIIPAGYMPDFGALSSGEFKTVICHGSNTTLASTDVPAVPAKSSQHAHQPCAFSGLAAVTLASIDIGPFDPVFAWVSKLGVFAGGNLTPALAGPVLGSRGPPLFT